MFFKKKYFSEFLLKKSQIILFQGFNYFFLGTNFLLYSMALKSRNCFVTFFLEEHFEKTRFVFLLYNLKQDFPRTFLTVYGIIYYRSYINLKRRQKE